MIPRSLRLASFLGAMLATAPLFAASQLFPLYQKYQDAIAADDWPAAKAFLASAKVKELSSKPEDEALSAIDVISPKEDLRVEKEIIDGEDATLIVLAKVAENESVGRVQFVREKGKWKILSEQWDIGGSVEDDAPTGVRQPENDQQREALRKLRAMGFPEPTADFMVMSAVKGDLDALKLFIEAGYPIDWKDPDDGAPAIVSAAMFGHPEIVDWLIDHGADVNATDGMSTALQRIADKCDATPTIRKLIAHGAKVDAKTAGGATAKQIAEAMNCTENVKALSVKR